MQGPDASHLGYTEVEVFLRFLCANIMYSIHIRLSQLIFMWYEACTFWIEVLEYLKQIAIVWQVAVVHMEETLCNQVSLRCKCCRTRTLTTGEYWDDLRKQPTGNTWTVSSINLKPNGNRRLTLLHIVIYKVAVILKLRIVVGEIDWCWHNLRGSRNQSDDQETCMMTGTQFVEVTNNSRF